MIRRLFSALLLVWLVGFVLFVALLPRPLGEARTDGIVVLTGGPNRIQRGLTLMEQRQARRLLISGVNLTVRRRDFQAEYRVPSRLFECCVDLGQDAIDTRSNGEETAAWVRKHGYRSLRLITTDWHMRRARFELDQSLPAGVAIRMDAVRSEPDLWVLLSEYHKYLLRRAAVVFGL